MAKIACLKCNAKKYIRFGPKTLTLQGRRSKNSEEFFSKESSLMRRFFPRRYGAPVAIVLYYLNRDFR